MDESWREIAEKSISRPIYSFKRRRLSSGAYDIPVYLSADAEDFYFSSPVLVPANLPDIDLDLAEDFAKLYVF